MSLDTLTCSGSTGSTSCFRLYRLPLLTQPQASCLISSLWKSCFTSSLWISPGSHHAMLWWTPASCSPLTFQPAAREKKMVKNITLHSFHNVDLFRFSQHFDFFLKFSTCPTFRRKQIFRRCPCLDCICRSIDHCDIVDFSTIPTLSKYRPFRHRRCFDFSYVVEVSTCLTFNDSIFRRFVLCLIVYYGSRNLAGISLVAYMCVSGSPDAKPEVWIIAEVW